MFYAVATLLEQETWHGILKRIPDDKRLVASGKLKTQFIHFSWLVSEKMDIQNTVAAVESIASKTSTFDVVTGGFGIFPGGEPVVTMVLARNPQMTALQKTIWTQCEKHMSSLKQIYSPDAWIPHITLMHHDINRDDICHFLESVLSKEIHFRIKVDNLAIIYRDGNHLGQISRFDLEKENFT